MKKEVDANKDKILQFNELAKEMGYLEEEIGIKQQNFMKLSRQLENLRKKANS